MTPEHLQELRHARYLLENPGFAAKLSHVLGKPFEQAIRHLPGGWSERVGTLTQDALQAALAGALLTMRPQGGEASPWWHKGAAALSGAAGGFFGLPALAVELPLSTTILCRTIADVARANGESLDDPDTKLACLQVFALGGPTRADDGADAGYFAVRAALAKAVSDATAHLAAHPLAAQGAPALVRLIALIASRFQVQVGQKFAAQAVPVIGAAGGAMVNVLFTGHFQDMSRGHFTVRRLERIYGPELVRQEHDRLGKPS